jgi:hypothetical protein
LQPPTPVDLDDIKAFYDGLSLRAAISASTALCAPTLVSRSTVQRPRRGGTGFEADRANRDLTIDAIARRRCGAVTTSILRPGWVARLPAGCERASACPIVSPRCMRPRAARLSPARDAAQPTSRLPLPLRAARMQADMTRAQPRRPADRAVARRTNTNLTLAHAGPPAKAGPGVLR